ncbi:MAG: GNAT family N-acetyltransferase [Nitrosomonas sp.]|jgi:GNAT superfamily N-acetyltransferase|nr:GNAT family N-acetyltransferase [Nitrosomonas sp.]
MKDDVTDVSPFLSQFTLVQALPQHSRDICDLINLAYRGDRGWTRETHIIGGDRTTPDEIAAARAKPGARFYVVYLQKRLVACIYLVKEQYHAYIGFFSVHPDFQGQGIGGYILRQAEIIAKHQFLTNKIRMFVVSQRAELIAFYQRRGYQHVGGQQAYPLQLKIGVPKVANLTIEYLEKQF